VPGDVRALVREDRLELVIGQFERGGEDDARAKDADGRGSGGAGRAEKSDAATRQHGLLPFRRQHRAVERLGQRARQRMSRNSATAIASQTACTTAGQTDGVVANAWGATRIGPGIESSIVPMGECAFHGMANFTSARKTIA
jgi:hypothetical protein